MDLPKEEALILEPTSPRPYPEIGRILASRLGLHPTDAVARVRYGGGILANRAPVEALEEIARDLKEHGVEARVVPPEVLENIPRGYRSTRLEILDEALCARLVGEKELVLLRSDFRAIQIHALQAERLPEKESSQDEKKKKKRGDSTRPLSGPTILEASLETRVSPRARKVLDWIRTAGDPPPRLILTLYGTDPVGPVRLEHGEIDFSTLGKLKLPHSMDNFLLLLETLVDISPGLLNRDRVIRFLDRLDPREILYFKQEEGQNFDRWIQAWIRILDSAEPSG